MAETDFADGDAVLAADGLVAGYTPGIDILRDLSCRVWPHRISCVVGPNGTGKSTLLKALFGFLRPRNGKVMLKGADVTGTEPHHMLGAGVAYLPQRPSLFPHLTVESNLKLGLWHARVPKAEVRRKLEQAYTRFPMAHEKRNQPAGQQRQVEIARSLLTEPPVYLIDEPTAGIDPRTSENVYELIASLARGAGKAILLVDQDIKSAMAIADYVYVVKNGSVASQGSRTTFGRDTDALVARWLYASGG
jgi:branched-chain amino acid transport system ATP-binding protein